MKHTTHSDQETFELGQKFASKLKGGEVIGLIGDLGAGKTVFTKGLAAGLGVKKVVNSPTFVIMKVYRVESRKLKVESKKPKFPITDFVHIDAYRLNSFAELESIGAPDYFGRPETVTVIEWINLAIKDKSLRIITITFTQKNNARIIEIKN